MLSFIWLRLYFRFKTIDTCDVIVRRRSLVLAHIQSSLVLLTVSRREVSKYAVEQSTVRVFKQVQGGYGRISPLPSQRPLPTERWLTPGIIMP